MKSPIPDDVVLRVFEKSGGHCWYCGLKLDFDTRSKGDAIRRNTFTIDHFVAGKNHDISNLVPACMSCNSAKGNYALEEFRGVRKHQASKRMAVEQGIPSFSEAQVNYLYWLGYILPPLPDPGDYFFYFEQQGLQR